jgi:hypothetical protein
MFSAPGHVFSGIEGVGYRFHVLHSRTRFRRYGGRVGSHFHVLRTRTHFRRYKVRRVPFSCFVLPNSFSAVPRATGPVFMLCAPRLVVGGTEDVGSRFHVLRSRKRFGRYRGRRVPLTCFEHPDSFSTVPRASSPIFMFCTSGLVFGDTEGVRSRFHVFRSRSCF